MLHIRNRRHREIILAVVHNPFPLVELLLLAIGIGKVLHTLFLGQAINGPEVPEQPCPMLAVPDKKQMPDVVTVLAQGLKSS